MHKSKKITLLSAIGGSALLASAAFSVTSCSNNRVLTYSKTTTDKSNVEIKLGQKVKVDFDCEFYDQDNIFMDDDVIWNFKNKVEIGVAAGITFDFDNGELTIDATDAIGYCEIVFTVSGMPKSKTLSEEQVTPATVRALIGGEIESSYAAPNAEITVKANSSSEGIKTQDMYFRFYDKSGVPVPVSVTKWVASPSLPYKHDNVTVSINDDGLLTVDASKASTTEGFEQEFKIYAQKVAEPELDIDQMTPATIKVKVERPDASQVEIQGDSVIKLAEGYAETTKKYTATVSPSGAIQDVNWNVISGTTDHIQFNDGNLTIKPGAPDGEYKVIFNATTKSYPQVASRNFWTWVKIGLDKPTGMSEIDGKDSLTYEYGKATQEDYDVSIEPATASQQVKWTIADTSGKALPEGISIDADNGKLTIAKDTNPDLVPSILTIKATAVEPTAAGIYLSKSKDVTISSSRPTTTSVKIAEGEAAISYQWTESGYQTTYKAQVSPYPYADQDVNWTVTDASGLNVSGVTIEEDKDGNGILKISKDVQPSNFNIKITATSVKDPLKSDTKDVNINVEQAQPTSIVINGENTLTAYFKEETTFIDKAYKATVNPSPQAPQNVKWSIVENEVNGISIDANTGVINVKDNVALNTYTMKICATSTENENVKGFKTITVIVKYKDVTDVVITSCPDQNQLTFVQGIGGTTMTNCKAQVNPYPSANQEVTWSISSGIVNGITIDQDGYIKVDSSVIQNDYNISVRATSVADKTKYAEQSLIVKVIYSDIASVTVNGSTTQTFVYNGSEQISTAYTAIVKDAQGKSETVPQDVTWVITDDTGYAKLDGFEMNTNGQITCDGEKEPGTYNGYVVAVATSTIETGYVSGYVPVTITVKYDTPSSMSIEGSTSYSYTRSQTVDTHDYTAPILPTYALQDVEWTVTGEDTGITHLVSNNTLSITTDNTASAGIHTINITATSKAKSDISQTATITITVNNPSPETVTIIGADNFIVNATSGGETKYSATVGPEFAPQDINWSIDDTSSSYGYQINENGVLTAPAGLIVGDTHTVTVTATSKTESSATSSKDVNVTVANLVISGSDAVLYVNKGYDSSRNFTITTKDPEIMEVNSWKVVDAHTKEPIDGITISNTGVLSIANTMAAGKHTIDVCAVGTYAEWGSAELISNHIIFDVMIVDVTQKGLYILGDTSKVFTVYTSGGSRKYTAKQMPVTSTLENLRWTSTVEPEDSGVTFENGSIVVAKGTAVGNYTVTFSATGEVDGETITSETLTVTVEVKPTEAKGNKLTYADEEYTLVDDFDPNSLCWVANEESYDDLSIEYYPVQGSQETDTLTIPWEYKDSIASVVIKTIKEDVYEINDNFLYGCYGLSEIDLTGLNNITSIGNSFIAGIPWEGATTDDGFKSLTSIDLSPLSNVTSIGNDFMFNCSALTAVDINPLYNIESLGSFFMQGCKSLMTLDFTNMVNITSIGEGFMAECTGLVSLDISPMQSTLVEADCIGRGFLQDCLSLLSLNIGSIPYYAFQEDNTEESIRCTLGIINRYFTESECKFSPQFTYGLTVTGDDVEYLMVRFGYMKKTHWWTYGSIHVYAWRYLKDGN